jgi:putative ABC transport system permease protein
LGRSVVDNLFAGEDPLGKTIRIGTRSFQVIGVMETKGTQGFSDRDDVIFVPLFTAQKKMLGVDYLNSISVEVVNKESVDEARSQIEKILQERHKIKEGEENDFNVFNLADIETVASSVANTLTLVLASIAGISLIVGGIGIMNIMLVSVTERTREIGLRKAVGARQRNILGQFLIESVILATLGGITGLMFGWIGSKVISKLGGWRTYIPWQWAVIAVGFAAAVGLFSGVYPARKAAKLDPIVALRYE